MIGVFRLARLAYEILEYIERKGVVRENELWQQFQHKLKRHEFEMIISDMLRQGRIMETHPGTYMVVP